MIYNVAVEELVWDVFEIEADSQEEALEKAQKLYYNEEIILEPWELLDVQFSIE